MNINNILTSLCLSALLLGCHAKDANTEAKEKAKEEINRAYEAGNSRESRVINQNAYCGGFPHSKSCPIYHENYCKKYPTDTRNCPFSYADYCKSSTGAKECLDEEHAIDHEAFCQSYPKDGVCEKK